MMRIAGNWRPRRNAARREYGGRLVCCLGLSEVWCAMAAYPLIVSVRGVMSECSHAAVHCVQLRMFAGQ